MRKFFYVMIAALVCMMLCISVSAETVEETVAVTEMAVETVAPEVVTQAEQEASGNVNTSGSEKAYWGAVLEQTTDWINGHPEVLAFLTAAAGFVASIIALCKYGEKLIKMALALRREGDEKNEEARAAISENQKEMVAIAEENKEMQERILAAEEKNARAMAGMAWCVERLIEESNLPTYKKDEIRTEFKKTVGGDGHEGGDQA